MKEQSKHTRFPGVNRKPAGYPPGAEPSCCSLRCDSSAALQVPQRGGSVNRLFYTMNVRPSYAGSTVRSPAVNGASPGTEASLPAI